MRISDWSSDVCSSDLRTGAGNRRESGNAVRRRLGAVRGTERIHHIDIAERRHLLRQRFVVGLFAQEKARVLAERDLARFKLDTIDPVRHQRSEEHTSELQSLMRISYAVFCLKQISKNHEH